MCRIPNETSRLTRNYFNLLEQQREESNKNLNKKIAKMNSRYGPETSIVLSPEQLQKKRQELKTKLAEKVDAISFDPYADQHSMDSDFAASMIEE